MTLLAGIFVGGSSSRMGGRPKGLLRAPDGSTLVGRLQRVLARAGVERVVLVGAHPSYEPLGLASIADAPPGVGPLGGLVALLREAQSGYALALACDMPFVSARLIDHLVGAPPAPVVAPRRDGRWEPLCARYDAAAVLPLAESQTREERYSLQRLLDRARATELSLDAEEVRELHDWDAPADTIPHRGR